MQVNTKGAKALTGSKEVFDYYKSKGIDVEFSDELSTLRKEYDAVGTKLKERNIATGYAADDQQAYELALKLNELSQKMGQIHTD